MKLFLHFPVGFFFNVTYFNVIILRHFAYINLLSYSLLEKDDRFDKEYFNKLEKAAHRLDDKEVIDCYMFLVCTTAMVLINRFGTESVA